MKSMFTCICTSCDIFILFLHAVAFSLVLHLDVIRSQIQLKIKVKTELPYVWYNAGQPIAISIYLHSTSVLCDNHS